MSTKTIQDTFDTITTKLKANGTEIGARQAYELTSELIAHLNRMGFDIVNPPGFDSDLTPPQIPGYTKEESDAIRGIG